MPETETLEMELEMAYRDLGKFLENFPEYSQSKTLPDNHGLKDRVVLWLERQMRPIKDEIMTSFYDENPGECLPDKYLQSSRMYRAIALAWPNFDPDMPGYIVMWADEKARKKGRAGRVTVKAGRAFRKIFPVLTDSEIETLVDAFRKSFAVREFKVHYSQKQKDFLFAYSGEQSRMENPYVTNDRKPLCTSCMRHSYDHLPNHPAEAYASGDFTIFWATDNDNLVAGRCVVFTNCDTWQAGPVYGVSEHAMDMIANCILEQNHATQMESRRSDWEGAKLLNLPYDNEAKILPYFDVSSNTLTESYDGSLVVDSDGEFFANTISGYVYPESKYCCDECGDRIDENERHEHDGSHYCEYCFDHNFSYCSHCEEYHPISESNTVYRMYRYGQTEEYWCDSCTSDYSVETVDGSRWHECDTHETYNGEYVSTPEYESNYFTSDWSCDVYHINDHCEIETGESVAISELEDDEQEWECRSGIWYVKQEGENDERETSQEEAQNA